MLMFITVVQRWGYLILMCVTVFIFFKGLGTKESDEINMFHVKLFQIFIIPQRLLNTCEIVKV